MPYAFGISPTKAHKIEAAGGGGGEQWLLTDLFIYLLTYTLFAQPARVTKWMFLKNKK